MVGNSRWLLNIVIEPHANLLVKQKEVDINCTVRHQFYLKQNAIDGIMIVIEENLSGQNSNNHTTK